MPSKRKWISNEDRKRSLRPRPNIQYNKCGEFRIMNMKNQKSTLEQKQNSMYDKMFKSRMIQQDKKLKMSFKNKKEPYVHLHKLKNDNDHTLRNIPLMTSYHFQHDDNAQCLQSTKHESPIQKHLPDIISIYSTSKENVLDISHNNSVSILDNDPNIIIISSDSQPGSVDIFDD